MHLFVKLECLHSRVLPTYLCISPFFGNQFEKHDPTQSSTTPSHSRRPWFILSCLTYLPASSAGEFCSNFIILTTMYL